MKIQLILFIYGLVVFPFILFGQMPDQLNLNELEKVIFNDMKISGAPGAVIGIVRDGQIIYQKAFGAANVNTGMPVTNSTVFQIGSVTKTFTALALLKMCENKNIDINRPIGDIITGFPPGLSQVTIHQLLSHSAGILDSWQNRNTCKESLYEYFLSVGDSVFFEEPGKIFSYSNGGYALAGLILSHLNKSSYIKAIDDILLKPLAMTSTTFSVNEVMVNYFATGHVNGKAVPVSSWVTSSVIQPAGGLFSNVADMTKFVSCLMNDTSISSRKIIGEKTVNKMKGHHQPNGFPQPYLGYPNSFYGYGLISYTYKGIDFIGNGGETISQNALLVMAPKYKTAVMIFSNTGYYPFISSLEKAVDIFLPVKQEKKRETHLTPDTEQIIGRYYEPNLSKSKTKWIEIGRHTNGLQISFSGKSNFELTQLGEDRFQYQDPNFKFKPDVKFYRNQSGKVVYLNFLGRVYKKD